MQTMNGLIYQEYNPEKDEWHETTYQNLVFAPLKQNDIVTITLTPTIFEFIVNGNLVNSFPHNITLSTASVDFDSDGHYIISYLGYTNTYIDDEHSA